MCLAFPGKITEIDAEGNATVDYVAEKRRARVLMQGIAVGDYVIVQGGVVVETVDRASAEKWIATIADGDANGK